MGTSAYTITAEQLNLALIMMGIFFGSIIGHILVNMFITKRIAPRIVIKLTNSFVRGGRLITKEVESFPEVEHFIINAENATGQARYFREGSKTAIYLTVHNAYFAIFTFEDDEPVEVQSFLEGKKHTLLPTTNPCLRKACLALHQAIKHYVPTTQPKALNT
jgi:hypothetical protein